MCIKQVKICFSRSRLVSCVTAGFLRSAIWEYVAVFQYQIYHKDNLTEQTAKLTM